MVSDLTGLDVANASPAGRGDRAAEAMNFTLAVGKHAGTPVYLVDEYCHPQTIAVIQTRAEARGVRVVVAEPETFTFEPGVIGALVQYPATDGASVTSAPCASGPTPPAPWSTPPPTSSR